MNEGEVQRACLEYLQYLQNQGKLWHTRLNAGEFQTQSGRWAKGCPPGTADAIVIREIASASPDDCLDSTEVLFVEFKSATGKQSPEQVVFQAMVEAQGCRYVIVRSAEELQEIVPSRINGIP